MSDSRSYGEGTPANLASIARYISTRANELDLKVIQIQIYKTRVEDLDRRCEIADLLTALDTISASATEVGEPKFDRQTMVAGCLASATVSFYRILDGKEEPAAPSTQYFFSVGEEITRPVGDQITRRLNAVRSLESGVTELFGGFTMLENDGGPLRETLLRQAKQLDEEIEKEKPTTAAETEPSVEEREGEAEKEGGSTGSEASNDAEE